MNTLHSRLVADTRALAETDFAWLRYMNDQRFAWLIIVPKQADLREWFELEEADQQRLLRLVNGLSRELQQATNADKMNLGALGNLVPQLHLHVIARHQDDACWPGPVWGQGEPQPYADEQAPEWLPQLRRFISDSSPESPRRTL